MGNYSGNKKLFTAEISELLNKPKFNGMKYLEPFVGMGHILRCVINKRKYQASDYSPYVYYIFRALQRIGHYPDITKEMFDFIKERRNLHGLTKREWEHLYSMMGDRKDEIFTFDELKAFAALATFRSQPWSTYQGNKPQETRDWKRIREEDYILLLKSDTFKNAEISHKDYREYPDDITDTVIYADGPYWESQADNGRYYGSHADDFDFEEYWNKIRKWSNPKLGNAVFISEYNAPKDFITVASIRKNSALGKRKYERVFMMKDNYIYWQNFIPQQDTRRSKRVMSRAA